MALAIAAGAYWFFSTTKGGLSAGDAYQVYAYMPDAAGLSLKSKVSLGGLTVGTIEDIHLVDMDDATQVPPEDRPDYRGKQRHGYMSKVTIWIKKKFPIRTDTRLQKETEGLIGSRILRLYPETDYDRPEGMAPFVKDGEQLRHVEWEGDLDKLSTMAKGIGGQIQQVIDLNKDDLRDIVHSVRNFMGPDPGGSPPPSFPAVVKQLQDTMEDVDRSLTKLLSSADGVVKDNREVVKELLENINRITTELKNISEGQGDRGVALDTMVRNVTQVTEDLRHVVADIRELTGGLNGADGGPSGRPTAGVKDTVDRLNKNLANLEQITDRVQKGEGNVGRFLKDDKLINDVEDAVDGATDFINGLSRTDTHVDILAWYNARTFSAHNGISVRFQPKPDKYYLLEFINDPKRAGLQKMVTTRNLTDGTSKMESITEVTDSFKISLMWAKMWGPMTLRVGLVEGSGGVGGNFNFWDDRVQFRWDLFQFSLLRFPRWRGYGQIQPVPHLYVLAGLDDPLNFNFTGMVPRDRLPTYFRRDWTAFDWRNPNSFGATDVFVGGGITFTDDDLRAVFTQIPSAAFPK
ncbi:MAG: MCE family protein [Deltaproteobacteria bacterium]|nr:MCE family protein [Deltaproteobacteria bacterium]